MRTIRAGLLLLCTGVLLAGVAGCSQGPTAGEVASSGDVLKSVPNSLPVTTDPPLPGAVKPVTVKLSDECLSAVKVIREVEAREPAGLLLAAEDRLLVNEALDAGRRSCNVVEYSSFTKDEVLPWLRMPPAVS